VVDYRSEHITVGESWELATYVRPRSSGAVLVFAHATGLHARVFDPLVELLDEHHVVAYDARGHGSSSRGPEIPQWQMYGDDAALVSRWVRRTATGRPVVGVGHSMGATALLMAAIADASLFDALVVVEPIVFPPGTGTADSPLAAGARRRRRAFASRESALANFSAKAPLNSLDGRALSAYVVHGLVSDGDEFTLRCDPEYEARTYEMGVAHDTWLRLGNVSTPTLVVAGAHHPHQPSAIAPDIADRIPHARFERWDDAGHFAPLEQPERFVALLRREIAHLTPTLS
jgi:pimeloyl-ACP methyl ester carboxylesterase